MSITFSSDAPKNDVTGFVSCMCAQFAPSWPGVDNLADLQKHASPSCATCRGKGVYLERGDDGPMLNLNSANAVALLGALGFVRTERVGADIVADAGCYALGRRTIEQACIGLARAKSADLNMYIREVTNTERLFSQPFTSADLRERIGYFESFLREAINRGALFITWG